MFVVWIIVGLLVLVGIIATFILVLKRNSCCSGTKFKLIPQVEGKRWPKQIFLTYVSKEKVPQKIWNDLKTFAPDFKLRFSDDHQAEEFIQTKMAPEVLHTYKQLKLGAHRADLWRYCVLWHYGGVYLDIKTHLVKPVSSMFPDQSKNYTVLSKVPKTIYQGILVVKPHSSLMSKAIEEIIQTNPKKFGRDYLLITKQLYHIIHNSKDKNNWVLYKEICTTRQRDSRALDKYGLCCDVVDPLRHNALVCYTRHADFGKSW